MLQPDRKTQEEIKMIKLGESLLKGAKEALAYAKKNEKAKAKIQNKEDYFLADARLKEKNQRISLDEALKQLNLED